MGEIKDKEGATTGYFHEREPFPVKRDLRTPAPLRYPSTTSDLIGYAREFFDQCIAIMETKNARYAGAYDPFRNLRAGGEYGIAIRMGDKVSRLTTLTHPVNTVDGADESVEDTCHDTANYAMLLSALRSNERGE